MRYKRNSEYWYADAHPLMKRLRRWLVSTGWEMSHWTQVGYSYRWQARRTIRLTLRARGDRSRLFALYSSLCPLSLLGGRITFQSFGVNAWSRRRQAWYCLHYDFKKDQEGRIRTRWYAYRSHNATPWGADTWYFGAPREVIQQANHQAEQMAAERERREARSAA